MIPTLLLALALKSVAHQGTVLESNDGSPAIITVRTCGGKLADIYQDPKFLIPQTNPLYVDKFGEYSYYSVGPYEEVDITVPGQPVPIKISTCPEKRR